MRTIRVLIADDTPQVRQDLRTVLTLAGQAAGTAVDVLGEASDGREAVRQAEALQPDIVIIDLEMPLMDGCAATREIKASSPNTRVLVLTLHGDETHRLNARQAGADAFVVKGAPIQEIIQQIYSLVQEGDRK